MTLIVCASAGGRSPEHAARARCVSRRTTARTCGARRQVTRDGCMLVATTAASWQSDADRLAQNARAVSVMHRTHAGWRSSINAARRGSGRHRGQMDAILARSSAAGSRRAVRTRRRDRVAVSEWRRRELALRESFSAFANKCIRAVTQLTRGIARAVPATARGPREGFHRAWFPTAAPRRISSGSRRGCRIGRFDHLRQRAQAIPGIDASLSIARDPWRLVLRRSVACPRSS